MPKNPRKRGGEREESKKPKLQKSDAPRGRGRPRILPDGGLDTDARMAAVMSFFTKGKKPAEIVRLMQKEFGVTMTRQEPYNLILEAGKRGWLRYTPPPHAQLRQSYRDTYGGWLHDVEVVPAARFDQVAPHGAKMLLDLVSQKAAPHLNKEEVQIGIAGGNAMRQVVYEFAQLLRDPRNSRKLPKRLVFRALVSAWYSAGLGR